MIWIGTVDISGWQMVAEFLRWPLTAMYLVTLALVCMYGLHKYHLTWLYYRTRKNAPRADKQFESLPSVTVQLPMFNEQFVAERIITTACAIDWPGEKLQIQVLDDSTDESAAIAERCCQRMCAAGHDVQYIHRTNRSGYKAGALENGLDSATGEFIAVFDADFVPHADIIKRTIQHFANDQIGMVQVRWEHLNRMDSILTQCQAIFLDGHFIIEHAARNRGGRWMNFNGTAGIWRKTTIASAGGWQHDTLTEDMDLSYRAQLKGWQFVYLNEVDCPAELPPEINAFKSQQHRWTKGSIQTARKILPTIFRADVPLRIKIEAFFHMTSPVVYLLMLLMTLLFFPALFVNVLPTGDSTAAGWLLGVSLFMMGTASAGTFYVASQKERGQPLLYAILRIPMLMAIGIGICLNNAKGVVEALVGHESPFVRTPKYNTTEQAAWQQRLSAIRLPTKCTIPLLEILMGIYLLACVIGASVIGGTIMSIPFLILFASGYLYVGITSLKALTYRPKAPRLVSTTP